MRTPATVKAIGDVQAGDLFRIVRKIANRAGLHHSRRVREIHYYPVGGQGEGLLFGR
jgi:hypothetical protein